MIGHQEEEGRKRLLKRAASAGRAVVYAVLGWSAASTATGTGSSGGSGSTDGVTARLMSAPGGTLLVGAVGLAVVGIGLVLAYRGWAEKFTRHLQPSATSGDSRTPVVVLGRVGTSPRELRWRPSARSSSPPRCSTSRRSPAGSTSPCTSCSGSRSARCCWRSWQSGWVVSGSTALGLVPPALIACSTSRDGAPYGGRVATMPYEYRVLEVREKMIGGKMSGEKLEKLLNDQARQGWQRKAITSTEVKGRLGPGGVEGLLVTFERAV